jgi:hypothetical protein
MKPAISLLILLTSLAFTAPNPGTPTTPNIPSRELLPRFNTTDCCACFFLLRGTQVCLCPIFTAIILTFLSLLQFGGPRHCNDDCVCDWCGTNVKNAPYGTPCAGAGGVGNWTFCRNNCVLPTTSTTTSIQLLTSTTSTPTIISSVSQITGGDTDTTRTPAGDGGGITRTPTDDGGGTTRSTDLPPASLRRL